MHAASGLMWRCDMRLLQGCAGWVACTAFLLTATISPARAQVDFSETVTFGDSFTYNDVLGPVYDNPQSLYGADPLGAAFNRAAAPDDRLTNLAVAGASSWQIPLQIAAYNRLRLRRQIGTATVVNFQIGATDIAANINLLGDYDPGENFAADRIVDRLIARIRTSLNALQRLAPHATFIVWTIPDISETPAYLDLLSSGEKANIAQHIARVNAAIESYASIDNVLIFDMNALLSALIADPPELLGVTLTPPPAFGEPTDLFADELHPTAVTNGLLANGILAGLNDRFGTDFELYDEAELAGL